MLVFSLKNLVVLEHAISLNACTLQIVSIADSYYRIYNYAADFNTSGAIKC